MGLLSSIKNLLVKPDSGRNNKKSGKSANKKQKKPQNKPQSKSNSGSNRSASSKSGGTSGKFGKKEENRPLSWTEYAQKNVGTRAKDRNKINYANNPLRRDNTKTQKKSGMLSQSEWNKRYAGKGTSVKSAQEAYKKSQENRKAFEKATEKKRTVVVKDKKAESVARELAFKRDTEKSKSRAKIEKQLGRSLTKQELNDHDKAFDDAYGKYIRKASNAGKAKAVKVTDNKTLTQEELVKLQTRASGNPNLLKDLKTTDPKTAKKLAEQTVSQYTKGGIASGTQGALSRMTYGDDAPSQLKRAGLLDKNQTKAVQYAKENSKAYGRGEIAGEIANFLPISGMGGAVSGVTKGALKAGAKVGAKDVAKKAVKEGLAEGAVSLPLNVQSAIKDSKDLETGKIDKNQFIKSLALNVGGDVVLGGAVSGIGGTLTAKNVNKYVNLVDKIDTKGVDSLSAEEFKDFTKLNSKIKGKETNVLNANAKAKVSDAEKSVKLQSVTSEADKQKMLTILAKKRTGETLTKAERKFYNKSLRRLAENEGRLEKEVINTDINTVTPKEEVETPIKENISVEPKEDVSVKAKEEVSVEPKEKVKPKEETSVKASAEPKNEPQTREKPKADESIESEEKTPKTKIKNAEEFRRNKNRIETLKTELWHIRDKIHETADEERLLQHRRSERDVRDRLASARKLEKEYEIANSTPKTKLAIDEKYDLLQEIDENYQKILEHPDDTKLIAHLNNKIKEADKRIEALDLRITKPKEKNVEVKTQGNKVTFGSSKISKKASLGDALQDAKKIWTSIKRNFLDDYAGIEEVANKLIKDGTKSKNKALVKQGEDLMSATNAMRNAPKKAQSWINGEKVVSLDGRKLENTKTIEDIFKPYFKDRELYNELQEYLYHQHNIDRAEMEKGVFGEVTAEESQEIVKRIGKEHPEFATVSRDINAYIDDLQNVLLDAGVYNKEIKDMFNTLYPNYVPSHRLKDFEDVAMPNGKLSRTHVAKEATGGESPIVDLHEQLEKLTLEAFRDAEMNRAVIKLADAQGVNGKELMETAERVGVDIDPFNVAESTLKIDGDKITYFRDGVPYTTKLDSQIIKGIQQARRSSIENFVRNHTLLNAADTGASFLSTKFKKLIVDYNPVFTVKNGLRDSPEALMYSKQPTLFAKNYANVAANISFKNLDNSTQDLIKLYNNMGGRYSQLVDITKNLDKKWDKFSPIERIEQINNAVESLPRITEFISTLEKNGVDIKNYKLGDKIDPDLLNKAMLNANDVTVNFGRSGQIARYLNRTLVPFLNPSIQGLDKLIRSASGARTLESVIKSSVKLAAWGIPPVIANDLLLYDNETYKKIPDREKDTYFIFPVGDDKYIRIPKSRAQATLNMPITEMLRHYEYGDGYDWKYVLSEGWNQSGVVNVRENALPNIPLRSFLTRKTWYGADIEDYNDKELRDSGDTDKIWDETTTSVSKKIGATKLMKKLKISPKQLDNFFDSSTGMIFDTVAPLLTLEGKSDVPSKYKALTIAQKIVKDPFVNAFKRDATMKNKTASDFFEKYDKIDKLAKKAEQNPSDPKSAKILKQKEIMDRQKYKSYDYSDAMAEVKMNTSLSAKEKTRQIRELKARYDKVLNAGINGKRTDDCPAKYIGHVTGNYKNALLKYSDDIPNTKKDTVGAFKAFQKENGLTGVKWKDMTPKQKRMCEGFADNYNAISKLSFKAGSKYSTDYTAIMLVCDNTKLGDKITKSYLKVGVFENQYFDDNKAMVKKYHKAGFTNDDYAKSAKIINNYTNTLDGARKDNYYNTNRKAFNSVVLAGNAKTIDADYYINCYGDTRNMNAARGLKTFDKWNGRKGNDKFAKIYSRTLEKSKSSGSQYITAEDARKACEKNCTDTTEAACLFNLLTGGYHRNPYGEVPDFSKKGDSGLTGGKTYGGYRRGRRGYGHRRRGHGGGSGRGGSTSWESYLKGMGIGKATTTSKVKASDSELTEAYRKKLLKIQKDKNKIK